MSEIMKDLGLVQPLHRPEDRPTPEQELQAMQGQQDDENDILSKLIYTMDQLSITINSLIVSARMTEGRLQMIEKHLGYLLTKDPEFAANMEKVEKAREAAKVSE